MATVSIIKIEGVTFAKIVKHADSEPEQILDWLSSFNKDFSIIRGFQPNDKFAELLRSSVFDSEEFEMDKSKYSGFSVIRYDEKNNASYEYHLRSNGVVEFIEI